MIPQERDENGEFIYPGAAIKKIKVHGSTTVMESSLIGSDESKHEYLRPLEKLVRKRRDELLLPVYDGGMIAFEEINYAEDFDVIPIPGKTNVANTEAKKIRDKASTRELTASVMGDYEMDPIMFESAQLAYKSDKGVKRAERDRAAAASAGQH